MGFYLGSRGRENSPGEVTPTVTPREYVFGLSCAIRSVTGGDRYRRETYRRATRALLEDGPAVAVRALATLLAASPDDAGLHRALGLAQFCAGNLRGAVMHLETALALSEREATAGVWLQRSFRARLEGALARLALLHVHLWLGRRDRARLLASRGLIL